MDRRQVRRELLKARDAIDRALGECEPKPRYRIRTILIRGAPPKHILIPSKD